METLSVPGRRKFENQRRKSDKKVQNGQEEELRNKALHSQFRAITTEVTGKNRWDWPK